MAELYAFVVAGSTATHNNPGLPTMLKKPQIGITSGSSRRFLRYQSPSSSTCHREVSPS